MFDVNDNIITIAAGIALIGSEEIGEGQIQQMKIPMFLLGKFCVTNKEYEQFLIDRGYDRPELWTNEGFTWKQNNGIETPAFWNEHRFMHPDQPVTGVSFFEAQAFCKWVDGRLPSEIEWEKAARGYEGNTYPWGEDEPDLSKANYAPDFVPHRRSPVSVFRFMLNESPFGCRQMAGNVFEWCSDYFHFDTPSHRGSDNYLVEDRPSNRHVLKGGAWTVGAGRLRSAARWSYTPDLRDNILGFRVAFDSK